MEDIKLNEDVSQEDIDNGKKEAIKTMTGTEQLDLEGLSTEELDNILGLIKTKESTEGDDFLKNISPVQDIEDTLSTAEVLNMSESETIDFLKESMRMSLQEAETVVKDRLKEKTFRDSKISTYIRNMED